MPSNQGEQPFALPIKNQEYSPKKVQRPTVSVRIYADTMEHIRKAIEDGSVKDLSGLPANRPADIMDIALCKLLAIDQVSEADKRFIADYGFDTPQQLTTYRQALLLIPKDKCTPEMRKVLRQVILSGRVKEFIDGFNTDKIQDVKLAPEEF